MFRDPSGALVYSPSDLTVFLESRFGSWMTRLRADSPGSAPVPVAADASLELVGRLGIEHEAAYLARVRAAGRQVVDLHEHRGDDRATRAAIAANVEVLYQPRLSMPGFVGYADFLERVGDGQYEIVDTKLARSVKPYFVVQLCAYAEMLEGGQGRRPERIHVELGSGERMSLRTADYFYFYLTLKEAFLAFMAAFDPARPPEPEAGVDHGRWQAEADRFFEETDPLSRVAGMRRGQIRRFREAGIATASALGDSGLARVGGMQDATFRRLRGQARLQRASLGAAAPAWAALEPEEGDPRPGFAELPPASAGDVYFDIEGYPLVEGGLEYLFGAVDQDGFHPFWAHDRAAERLAFEEFVDWVESSRAREPRMHVYHYAPYEVVALKKLAGRFGSREDVIDRWLRAGVFVDLYRILRTSVQVGTAGYSLKDVEALYRPPREGDVGNAADSIVQYARWLDTREAGVLDSIRDYNRDDCESTRQLADWLRARQRELGPAWIPPAAADDPPEERPHPYQGLIDALLAGIPADRGADTERWRIQEIFAHLVGFHRREARPGWWAYFERQKKTEEELFEDLECLAGLVRTGRASENVGRGSLVSEYEFDPDQDTKLDEDDDVWLAQHEFVGAKILSMDRNAGRVRLKFGRTSLNRFDDQDPPRRLSLLPKESIPAVAIEDAIADLADRVREGRPLPPALDQLLHRRAPNVGLVREGEDPSAAAARCALALDGDTLCIQGPPGAGKTYTGARMIVQLLKIGKKVGVTANSHAAIANLLAECVRQDSTIRGTKIGGSEDLAAGFERGDAATAVNALAKRPLVGGTAWAFSKPDFEGELDALFVDEAGQVSLANLVGMARCAKNLVLLGDQMQLAQPLLGSHPGESGVSALSYLLQDHATIPPDLGIFLGTTWRLHPDICRFISGAVYEDRLAPRPENARRIVRHRAGGSALVPAESGIVWVPVSHEGNAQASDEEVDAIDRIVADLLGREVVTSASARPLALSDILFVAPYNMQVRRLQRRLGPAAKVGSVDLFQGQEAPVVIVSMCASSADASPRGMEFLLDRNRMNVAISRAQSLAIVVGSPDLLSTRASSLGQMRLLNLFSRLVAEATPSQQRRTAAQH